MDEREGFDAQQEAKRETLGKTDKSTRERMWDGLTKYLAAEARHTRKEAVSEKEAAERAAAEKEKRDRRSP